MCPTDADALHELCLYSHQLCEIIVLICLLTAIRLGLGHHDYYISPAALINIQKCLFPLGLFGFWASSLARISIGSMLLRFEISKTWRVVLWILIAIQFTMAIGSNIFQLVQCRPIRAMWEPVPNAVCWTARQSQSYGYIYSGSFSIECCFSQSRLLTYRSDGYYKRSYLCHYAHILHLVLTPARHGARSRHHPNGAWNRRSRGRSNESLLHQIVEPSRSYPP